MDNIKVAIRVRPLIAKEQQAGLASSWIVKDNVIAPLDKNKKAGTAYTFDRVYDEHTDTYSIFEDMCKPIIDAAVAGFHGTIFAYGQSSSGKTFTMSGNRLNPGIMSLSVEEIFGMLNDTKDREFLLRVSYLELYNEKLTDLLAKPSEEQQLYIKDNDGNIEVRGLKEEIINTSSDVYDVIKIGEAKKTMAETKQNDRSSRSHCILRMVIESRKTGEDDSAVNVSHLNFVDLAGSEKAGENTGDRLREGCHINLSLFYLSQCISKLSDGVGNQHVNYRDSKLTRILQNALGGNSKTAIICAITPASVEESHSTLRFASTAKTITNKPKVNECLSDAALLKRYKSELQRLQKLVDEKGIAVSQAEKEDLQKKLIEKETAQRQQEELIEKLKKIIITTGNQPVKKPQNTKMRRLTWCPGNTLNFGRNRMSVGSPPSEMRFKNNPLPMIEDISPPRDLLEDTETLSFRITTRPKLDETRRSFFDNKSIFVSPEPQTKKYLELQNKHEFLQEDFEKLQKEMVEDQVYREQECIILQDAVQELTMESEALKKSNSEMLAEMKTLKEERNIMSDEVYKLQHKLQIQSTKLSDFQNELTNIRDEKTDKPKGDNSSSKSSDPDREEYEQQIKSLKEQNEKLSTEISDLKNINEEISHRQSLSDDMYSQKLKEMQEKSDLYDSTVSDFMEEIQKAESDKEELKKEKADYEQRIRVLISENEEESGSKQEFNSQELETVKKEYEEKVKNAAQDMEELKKDCEKRIKTLVSKHDEQKQYLQSEIITLKSRIEILQSTEQEGTIDATDVLDVKLHMEAVVNSNKEQHESEVKNLKEGYEQTIENLNMEISQLKLDVTELKGQNSYLVDPDSLYSEFQSIAETLKLEKQEELQALKEDFELQKECMQLDITRLQDQLENDHHNDDNDPADDVKMEDLKAEYEKFVEDIKQDFENEKQVFISKISELESKLEFNETKNVDEVDKNESDDSGTMIKKSKMDETMEELKQEYEQKINLLRSECSRLKSEVERLENSEKSSDDNRDGLEMSAAQSQVLESVQAECEALKEKLAKLEASDEHGQLEIVQMECEALKEKLAKLETSDEHSQLEIVQAECEALKEKLAKLETSDEHSQLEIVQAECEALKEKLAKLESENVELKNISELDENEKSKVDLMENMKQEYEEKLEFLTNECSRLQSEVERLEKSGRDGGIKIEFELSRSDSQDQELSSALEECKELKQTITKLENENEELKKIIELDDMVPREFGELKQKITKLENENDELKKITELDGTVPEEYSELKQKITKLENENEELKKIRELDAESDLHETEKLRQECETLREEVEKLQTTKNKLTEEMESSDIIDEFKEKVDGLNQQNEALLEQINQLEINNQNLQEKLTNIDKQTTESEPDSQDGKLKELENEMQALKSENFKLVDEKADAEEGLENLIMECEMLKEKIEKMERGEDGRNSVCNGNMQDLEDEKAKLKEYCTSLEMEIETLKLEKTEMYEETVKDFEVEMKKLKNDNFTLQSTIEKLQCELRENRISMSHLHSDETVNLQVHSSVSDVRTEYEAKLETKLQEIENLNTEIKNLKEKLIVQNTKEQESKEKTEMYEETVKDFEVEMKKLKNDNFTLQSTIEKLQCELRENRISMSHLHSDETVNLQVHSSVSDVRTEYEAKLETKLQEIENLNTEIKNLKEKLIVQNTKEQESKEKTEMYEETVKDFEVEMKKLKNDNFTLQSTIEKLQCELRENRISMSHLHSDETVNLQVHSSVSDVRTEYEAKLETKLQEIENLNTEIKNLKEKLIVQNTKEQESKEKTEMYEETVKDFEVEMKKLKNDNFTLQSTIEKLQCELRENRISMSHLHSDETVNLQVHSSVSDVRTEYEAKLETKLQEIENLNTEIKNLKEKLIVQNTKEQESKEKTEMYEETVKDFEVEMKKLKNDNFTLQSTIEKLQCELRENRISMSHLHSDETVNLQVHSSVSDVRTEYEAKLETKLQEIENLNTEIKNLKEKLIVQNTKEQESKEVDKEDWKYKFQLERQLKKAAEKQMKDEVTRLKEIIQLKDNFIEEERTKDRECELNKRLEETENKLQETGKEADELTNKLEKEKEKLEKSEKKLNDTMKQNLKFKQMYADAANKSKDHEKQMKTLETEVADKNLEIYNLKRSVSKAETQQEKRTKQYEETIHYYEKINRDLKNQIRRLQSVDESFAAPPPPPSSSSSSSSKDRGYAGTSSAGGAIDHFAVIMLEGEKKRLLEEVKQLKKENAEIKKKDKSSSSVCNCKQSVSEMKVSELKAKLHELEKENIDLKKNMHDLKRDRSKVKHELPFHDLNDISNSTQPSSDEPSSMWTVPQFKIPDLEKSKKPKVPDAEQCKQQ